MIADITEKKTGKKIGVPVKDQECRLLKKFSYWRAYFFRIGCGLPIAEKNLKSAQEGDFQVSFMKRGKVVWEG